MAELLVIDGLVKIAEKLVELLKYRKALSERAFDKQVAPLYESMSEVHSGYLNLFGACRLDLESDKKLSEIVEGLVSDRLEQEPLRESVLAMSSVFEAKDKPEPVRAFFREIRHYFLGSKLGEHSTRASMLLHQMEHWVNAERRGSYLPDDFDKSEARSTLIEAVDETLRDIRSSWKRLGKLYAESLDGVS